MRKKVKWVLLGICIAILLTIAIWTIITNSKVIANNEWMSANANIEQHNKEQNIVESLVEENKMQNTWVVDIGKEEQNSILNLVTTINLLENATEGAKVITKIKAGQAFTILSEENNYFYVQYGEEKGWLDNTLCMVNLPDIIPSIVYDDTNSYRSIFQSSGYSLPDITGKQLYNASSYNSRLQETQYNMPVMYQMAKKI